MTSQDNPLVERFEAVCRAEGERSCASDAEGSLSFAEVWQGARNIASELSRRAPAARRVALLCPASTDWVLAFWGVLASGRLLVPLVDSHPPAEHARALRGAGVGLLVVPRALRARAEQALAALGESATGDAAPIQLVELEALLAGPALTGALSKPPPGAEPGVLFFTSGTSGEPKRAVVSSAQLAALARLVGRAWGVTAADRLLHCLPLHHTHGLGIAFLVCTLAGASVHWLGRFEPSAVWEAFETSSVFMAVPTMHQRLLDALQAAAPSVRERWLEHARRQRLITSGSAALPERTARRWHELLGTLPLERFGMTEVGVALSNPLLGERRPGSCGQVLPGMQVRIVDEAGRDVAPGAPGEIWIRGPSVFTGYDADPAATEQSFSDGWFMSGDIATWLTDGYVKILGRKSIDIIKSGGYKLSALEIEEALRCHAAVADAAVVGLPDLEWGELAVAAVVLDGAADPERLREFLKQELAPYKVPRRIVCVTELPRNSLGKVQKQHLRQQLEELVLQASVR